MANGFSRRSRRILAAMAVAFLGTGAVLAVRMTGASPSATAHSKALQQEPALLSAEEMLDVPMASIDYGVAALVLTRRYVPDYDVIQGLKKLDEIADRVRQLLSHQPDGDEPEVRIAAINTVLYREYGFTYDLEGFPVQTPEKRLLGNLLTRGRGTCANLPDLYYAVAERLGFPIYFVEAPQHIFLRYALPGGGHINIEATASGGGSSDEDYIAEMEIPDEALESGWMMRTLSRREALLLLVEEETWFDQRKGDLGRLLRQSALLQRHRPNHAPTFWNAALWEVQRGRLLRDGAGQSDETFAAASFAQARTLAERALALGMVKPDNNGEYVTRQKAIRSQRSSEGISSIPKPEHWDGLLEIERLIEAPAQIALVRFEHRALPSALRRRLGPFAGVPRMQRDPFLPGDEPRDTTVQHALNLADEVTAMNERNRERVQRHRSPLEMTTEAQQVIEISDALNAHNGALDEQNRLRATEHLMQVLQPRSTDYDPGALTR